MENSETTQITLTQAGAEIVAAMRDGRLRHYNGAHAYLDGQDGSLVIIDHGTASPTRSSHHRNDHVAVNYRNVTTLAAPANEEEVARTEKFFASL